jgi:multidrug transporter EmrE-like cation transporter
VPFSVQLGLIFALLTALGSIVGFFLKHKGAVQAPPVDYKHPLKSSIALFRTPVYTLGCVVATTSWGFHVLALGLAPISVVQATIAGGLVLITVIADRVFGHSVTRREWIGVALTAAGLAFLAATLEGTADSAHHEYEAAVFYPTIIAATLTGAYLASRSTSGPALAISAGLLWAASDITIKALTGKTDLGVVGIVAHPFALIIVVLSLVALLISARSLQIGPVVPVIAITSATANALTIAAGPLVFGEPLPEEPLALALRVAAFALVIGAAALTPPAHAQKAGRPAKRPPNAVARS